MLPFWDRTVCWALVSPSFTHAETVYDAFFAQWAVNLDAFLAQKEPFAGIAPKTRRKLCDAFYSRLVGTDAVRVLLGMTGASTAERLERAKTAAEEMLAKVAQA